MAGGINTDIRISHEWDGYISRGRSAADIDAIQDKLWTGGPNQTIIGLQDASLVHKADDSGVDGDSGLTQTTEFVTAGDWVTLRGDAARLLLTNSTGSTVNLEEVTLRGKPVVRKSGAEGYIHDSFVDYEDIGKNGVREFNFGNHDTVTKDQLEQLADFWWKWHRTAKHVYKAIMDGMQHWLCPGEWYRLQIGSAGKAEYIDSVVELYNVQMARRPGDIGETVCIFREVEEAWKYDSNADARFVASGGQSQLWSNKLTLTVAPQYYTGNADMYCDGTSDEDEINTAIDLLSGSGINGVVHLLAGKFHIDGSIDLKSNVTIAGEGTGATIVEKNCNDYAIHGAGSSGSEIVNASVRDLTITRNASDTDEKYLMYCEYCDEFMIDNVKLYDSYIGAAYFSYCDELTISGLLVDDFGTTIAGSTYGVYINHSTNVNLTDCTIKTASIASYLYGLYIYSSGSPQTTVSLVNISISDLTGTATAAIYVTGATVRASNIYISNITGSGGATTRGLWLEVGECQIGGIYIDDVDNTTTASNSDGIYLNGDDNTVQQILAKNCSGTGVYISATADDNVLSGRSASNGTNLTDSGSGNDTTTLITT